MRDLKAGIIKPLKAQVFEASEIEQAFRFMARYFQRLFCVDQLTINLISLQWQAYGKSSVENA
jgi:hypothetical protein